MSGLWPFACRGTVYPARWAGLGKLLGLWPENLGHLRSPGQRPGAMDQYLAIACRKILQRCLHSGTKFFSNQNFAWAGTVRHKRPGIR
jgi:hypothetical protein